jgi:hypothetical protein
MTLLELRYDTRRGRFGRALRGDRQRVADRQLEPIDIAREMRVQELRDLIARGAYRVDAQAVAVAIVARLKAGERRLPQCS